jgi:glucuronate isomerase
MLRKKLADLTHASNLIEYTNQNVSRQKAFAQSVASSNSLVVSASLSVDPKWIQRNAKDGVQRMLEVLMFVSLDRTSK